MDEMSEAEPTTAPDTGLSRRDLLKIGAAAAVFAGGAAAGLRLTNERSALAGSAASVDDALVSRNFRVEIAGLPDVSANCIAVEIEPIVIDAVEGDPGVFKTWAPGDAHYGKANLSCVPAPGPSQLDQWIRDAASGAEVRKNITITLFKHDGSAVRTFNLVDCFPIHYDAGDYSPSSNVLVETITVKIDRVTLAP
jgi:phage tail-like protein